MIFYLPDWTLMSELNFLTSSSTHLVAAASKAEGNRIPRIFHFSVPTPILDQQAALIEVARRIHPQWEIKIWDDATPIENARLAKYRGRASTGAQRADLIRLDAVFVYGGVYLDSDFRVLRPFDDLIKHYDFFMGNEDGRYLTNALIGAAPRHPALDAAIAFLEENEPDWSLPPNETTGPVLFANLLRWRSDVNILPRETFYPYNWNEGERPPHRLSYAAHLWDHSWKEELSTSQPRQRYGASAKILAKRALRAALAAGLTGLRRAREAAEPPAKSVAKVAAAGSYACSDEIVANTVHGQKIVLDGHDLSVTPEVALRGWHEWPEESFVRRNLRGGDWFVDVGANVGVFTILAANLCGPLGRVLAFEPNPRARRLLAKSAAMNWYHDRIKISDAALGEANGTALLSYYPHRLGDGQIASEDKQAQPFRMTGKFLEQIQIEVSVLKLDDFIPVDLPIKMLKIDAEGHESRVLSGARRLLAARAFDFILLEASMELFTGNWKETVASLEDLIAVGYTAGTLDGEGLLIKHRSLAAALRSHGGSKTLVFAAA
jgi:FkbM family methyltransferase